MSTNELSKRISTRLAQDIVTGEIAAGAHLRAQELANQYQVSRTPIREAFTVLEEQGLVVRHPNRGYFVADTIPAEAIAVIRKTEPPAHDDYQTLAEDWLTDRLPEVVTERALRQRYQLTKTRLSELLARAAREGWAERKSGYGWRLLPVAKTAEAFDEIYRFRSAIEPAALLEPSFQLDRRILSNLRQIQERMLEGGVHSMAPEKLLDNGAMFHEEIMRMSGNVFFVSALERVNRMRRLMEYRAKINTERLAEQCGEHLEILTLLEQGEILEASFFMRRHLSGALRRKSRIAWDWERDSRTGELLESAPISFAPSA